MRPADAMRETMPEDPTDGPDAQEEDDLVVVDDDSMFTILLGRKLRRSNRRYRIFNDSTAALAHLERTNPRTLLIDLNMPGLDGLQLIEALAAGSRAAMPNVIMCSSCLPRPNIQERIGSLGARLITKDALLLENALLDLLDAGDVAPAPD